MERIASWRGTPTSDGTPTQNVFVAVGSAQAAAAFAYDLCERFGRYASDHNVEAGSPVSVKNDTKLGWLVIFNFVATLPEVTAVKPYLPAVVADGLYDFV